MTSAATVVLGAKPAGAKRQPLLWVAIAAVTLGALAAILILPRGDGSEAEREAAASTDPAPVTHRLRIESRPNGAEVRCGDEAVGVTPFEAEVRDGEKPCAYEIVAPGYEAFRVEPSPITANTTLNATLSALPEPAPTTSTSATTAPVAPPPTAKGPSTVPPPAPVPQPPAPVQPKPPDIRLER